MNKQILTWSSYCLAVFAALLAACSHVSLPEPQAPAVTPPAALVAAARNWFAQTAPTMAKPVAINWAKAHILAGWLTIPLAAEHKQAYRYLVIQSTVGGAFTGRIVEIVLEGKAPLISSVEQAVVAATKRLVITPKSPPPLPGFTGLLLVYSPAYRYENGFIYNKGVAQAQYVRLVHPIEDNGL